MKTSPFVYVAITTCLLITITVMSTLNVAFSWVFYLTVIGQISIILMVYNVLKDDYTTTKTFHDFYEDKPLRPGEDIERVT